MNLSGTIMIIYLVVRFYDSVTVEFSSAVPPESTIDPSGRGQTAVLPLSMDGLVADLLHLFAISCGRPKAASKKAASLKQWSIEISYSFLDTVEPRLTTTLLI